MKQFIVVEGPDNAGKSSLIKLLVAEGVQELKFPKRTSDGLFKIESVNDFAIFETMLDNLADGMYVIDRFLISNMVYEGIRCGKSAQRYIDKFNELNEKYNFTWVVLTRNKLGVDFDDDNISLSKDGFNMVIDSYSTYCKLLQIKEVQYLKHNLMNEVVHCNTFLLHELSHKLTEPLLWMTNKSSE